MSEHLEKPDYTQYVKPEKLFMRSRGYCIAKMWVDCRNYKQSDYDQQCHHIDRRGGQCLWREA